jgi:hypothetical protein
MACSILMNEVSHHSAKPCALHHVMHSSCLLIHNSCCYIDA